MKTIINIIIPLAIIAGAVLGYKSMKASKEPPKSKQPPIIIPVITTIDITRQDHTPPIITFGTVQSQFETNLIAQVPGKITFVSPDFRVGNSIPAKTVLLRIDDTDYQAALAQAQYNLTLAERTLAEETILAKQAADDWILSGRQLKNASDFALRKPQLKAAQANVIATKATIKKSQEDINRTEIKAPFDAIITNLSSSIGNFATTQTSLGTLLSSKTAEVRLPLTTEQSSRLQRPEENKLLTIKLTTPTSPGTSWSAKLVRTEPSIDPRNQITFIIAEIDNPYTTNERPLPIGTFVNAEIPAKTIKNSYKVPETSLVDDSFIWSVTTQNPISKNKPPEEKQKATLKKNRILRIHSQDGQAYIHINEPKTPKTITIATRPLTNFKPNNEVKPEPLTPSKTNSDRNPTTDS